MGGPVRPDLCRLTLAQARGLLAHAGTLLKRCQDTGQMVEQLRNMVKQVDAKLEGMPLQNVFELAHEPEPVSAGRAEFEWRVQEVEKAHMRAYRQFKQANAGLRLNGSGPLPDSVRKLIRDALRDYDGHLLKPEQRDEWLRESRVRAAGIGIFYCSWNTGIFPDMPSGEKPHGWSGPYLEHDRPWRRRQGKTDPVLRFSEAYFEARALAESGDA